MNLFHELMGGLLSFTPMNSCLYAFTLFLLLTLRAFALDVAVVGAGASGLTAAYYLEKQGHKVTIFEKEDRVGGKVQSIEFNGKAIELGALIITPGYHVINQLAEIYGPAPQIFPTQILFLNKNDKWQNYKGYSPLGPFKTLVQYKLLLRTMKRFPELNIPHLVPSMHPDLFLPLETFARKYGFVGILPPFVMSLTGTGYLFPENVPAYYALKLFKLIGPVGLRGYLENIIPFRSKYFKDLLYFKDGFSSLWENMARDFDVRINEKVLSIEGKKLITIKGKYTFDRFVLATDLKTSRSIIKNPSPELMLMDSKIKKTRFLVSVLKTKELPHGKHRSFYFYPNMTVKKINHIQSLVNFWDDARLYLAYQILDDKITLTEARKTLRYDLAKSLGIQQLEVVKHSEWSYFHHIEVGGFTRDVSNALVGLQGKAGIYYIGESLNFETVESAAQNAKWVVEKLFL
jgi:protoporphyrinogen oxidase